MTVKIEKGRAVGRITVPTSKSIAHRLLIAAALCKDQVSIITGICPCQDVLATVDCLNALGVKIEYRGDCAKVLGIDFSSALPDSILNCRESGSTLRFLIPLALLCGKEVTFIGTKKLISRPQSVYENMAAELGLVFKKSDESITVKGPIKSGIYRVRGDVSSQFITGLLFALSTLESNSVIEITTPIESRSYIDLTISALKEFGVIIEWQDSARLLIKGGQAFKSRDLTVEGDYSGSAFIEAFNLIGGCVEADGLRNDSLQGDRVYREHFGALQKGFAKIDLEDCPDLGPILFTVAALLHGGRFTGTKRLSIKESDRASAMKEELSKFGAELTVEENSVTVNKRELHSPTERLSSHNDHRVAMSLAVIATVYGGEIDGAEAVGKSYPDFFMDIKKLGITAYEI